MTFVEIITAGKKNSILTAATLACVIVQTNRNLCKNVANFYKTHPDFLEGLVEIEKKQLWWIYKQTLKSAKQACSLLKCTPTRNQYKEFSNEAGRRQNPVCRYSYEHFITCIMHTHNNKFSPIHFGKIHFPNGSLETAFSGWLSRQTWLFLFMLRLWYSAVSVQTDAKLNKDLDSVPIYREIYPYFDSHMRILKPFTERLI